MSIEWLRDLIICILGLVATGFTIFLAVLAYSLYRRIRPILDTARAISRTVAQVVGVVQGIRRGIATFDRFFRGKKEGGKYG